MRVIRPATSSETGYYVNTKLVNNFGGRAATVLQIENNVLNADILEGCQQVN